MNRRITNPKIQLIMKTGLKASLIFCLTAIFILILYCENSMPQAFYIGISLIQSGFFFIAMFIICGFIFDRYINQ